MSSPQLHTESIQVRQDESAAETIFEQHARGARNTGERRRRGPAVRGRRLAIAAALAVGVTSGIAAGGTSPSHLPATTAQGPGSALSTPALHVGATSATSVRRMRALEARGYVQITCQTDGYLMLNPRTHAYEMVRA